jgi:lysophospholipase L1-like esterase
MRRLLLEVAAVAVIVLATLFVSMVRGDVSAARAGDGGTVSYLALGDSLAVGFQPNRGETTDGYVDDLWRSVQQQGIPALSLRKVGCAGETSSSMITGKNSPCHYAAGSQLAAAVSFLKAHPGKVAFITIDIGVNDLINQCYDPQTGVFNRACAVDLLPRLQTRVRYIVDAVGTTAGPRVPIVGMTYDDPFLGFWGLVPGGRALARTSQRAFALLNAGLTTAYRDAGATVADVAATFRINDFTDTVVVAGRGRLPVNVALACKWTWFCSAKFAGDPHANRTGYSKIARTFDRKLQRLLPGHCHRD